jgi:hypothetical protein
MKLFVVVAAATLASCSGLKNPCTTNCGGGGGGNANLSLTISDTAPTNTSILSFTLPVTGIALVPSGGGNQVSVFSSQNFELTRLQSDTNLIAANVSVVAGTYTAVNVTVSAPSGVLINSSGAKVGTCVSGGVCNITGSAATVTYTFPSNSPLVLKANSNRWLNLDFNYNNAIVATNGSIDVTQTGVMTASTAVPAGVPSGNFANIDDFTGQITALSSSSITLKSQLRGSLTAAITSTTPWYDPQGQCKAGGSSACVGLGSVVSLQGLLSNTGVVTATSLDIIDASKTPVDEVEGIIYPTTCNGGTNYGMVLSDSVINTTGSPLAGANFGAGLCLTPSGAASFVIDTGILTGQGVPTAAGFNSSSDILAGQMVRAKVTGAATGTNGINATATVLILRFSRLTGTVGTTSGNSFTLSGLPTYLGNFSVEPQVQTYPSATVVEGSLTAGQAVSVSALYLNPASGVFQPFQAAKVRTP